MNDTRIDLQRSMVLKEVRNQRRKAIWLWIFGVGLTLFITMPSAVIFFYKVWGITGMVISATLLPFSLPIYPVVMAIFGHEHWTIIVVNFLFIGISFVMLMLAWERTYDQQFVMTANRSFRHLLPRYAVHIKDFYAWVWLLWIEWMALFFFLSLTTSFDPPVFM